MAYSTSPSGEDGAVAGPTLSLFRAHPFQDGPARNFCGHCDGTRTAEWSFIGSGSFVHPEQVLRPVIRGQHGIALSVEDGAR